MSIDVAAKLAQGAAAVGAIETYVAASQAVGRPAGGLTVAGVRDVYAAEAGLRLDAIEADSDALAALADVAEEGMRLEAEACDAVRQAWQGASGTVAAEFVERHLAGGAALVASLRDASAALRSLRDELAALVEHKVGTAVNFDGRRAAEHPVWLAEAEAVLKGLADDVAVEVVARHISPYVDGDVQSDWMPAMRDATDSVAAAYDGAVARLSDRPVQQFESAGTGSAGACPPGSAVDAWSAPLAPAGPPPQQWSPPAQAQWSQWPSGLANAMSSGLPEIGGLGGGGFGGLGGGAGLTGGLPALIGRIADALGSYSGSPDLNAADEIALSHPKVHGDGRTKAGGETAADRESEQDQETEKDQEADSETVPGRGDEPVAETPALPEMPAAAAPPESQPVGGVPLAQLSPPALPPPAPSFPSGPMAQVAQRPEPVPPRQVESAVAVPAPPAASLPQPLLPPLAAEAGATPARATAKPTEKPETPCSIAADELPQVGQ